MLLVVIYKCLLITIAKVIFLLLLLNVYYLLLSRIGVEFIIKLAGGPFGEFMAGFLLSPNENQNYFQKSENKLNIFVFHFVLLITIRAWFRDWTQNFICLPMIMVKLVHNYLQVKENKCKHFLIWFVCIIADGEFD